MTTSLALVTLFLAGAAFSTGAGEMVEGTTESAATSTEEASTEETATTEPEPVETVVPEPASTEPSVEPPVVPNEPAVPTAPAEPSVPTVPAEPSVPTVPVEPSVPTVPAEPAGPAAEAPVEPSPPRASPARTYGPAAPTVELELETHGGGVATVWLHRTLPDPTPPAARLSPAFARRLRQTAAKAGVDWALVLGVLRARGVRGRVPATADALQTLANQLAALNAKKHPWKAAFALSGRRSLAARAIALSRYNRAVRLRALVTGLTAATQRLERRVLKDERLDIYPGGRADIEQGNIDVRVLVLMLYLAEAHRQVTVSSLETGHRLYSRPGVISAHVYGLAVDITGLNKKSIYGNQEPGGLTERAVRNILLLPVEVRPRQVISLLGLGGPSFPLRDHADHIHVGY
jgi:outer membrane biosynthesis protein TonB